MKRPLELHKDIIVSKKQKVEPENLTWDYLPLDLLKKITKDFSYQDLCTLFSVSSYFLSLRKLNLSPLPVYTWTSNVPRRLFLTHYGMYFVKFDLPRSIQDKVYVCNPFSVPMTRDESILGLYYFNPLREPFNYSVVQTSKKLCIRLSSEYSSWYTFPFNPNEIKNIILLEDFVFFTKGQDIVIYKHYGYQLTTIKFTKDIDKIYKIDDYTLLFLSNQKLSKFSFKNGQYFHVDLLKELAWPLPENEIIEDIQQFYKTTNPGTLNRQYALLKTNSSSWCLRFNLMNESLYAKIRFNGAENEKIEQICMNHEMPLVLTNQNNLAVFNTRAFLFYPFDTIKLKEGERYLQIGSVSSTKYLISKSVVYTDLGRLFLIETRVDSRESVSTEYSILEAMRLIFDKNYCLVIFKKYFKIFSDTICAYPFPKNLKWEDIDTIRCENQLKFGFLHVTIFLKNTNQVLIYSMDNSMLIKTDLGSHVYYHANLIEGIVNGDPEQNIVHQLFRDQFSEISEETMVKIVGRNSKKSYKILTNSFFEGKKIISKHLSEQGLFRVVERKEEVEEVKFTDMATVF